MFRYRKMWLAVGILLVLGVLWSMVMSRKINPDLYFVRKLEPISFTHIYVNDYAGSLQITPGIGEQYSYRQSGKLRTSIGYTYSLYDDEFIFDVDGDGMFVLTQLSNGQSFALGKVVERKIQEYHGTEYYDIQMPKTYKASYYYKEGILPFYVPVQFTMMTSGGMKYSSEYVAEIISQKGDTLRMYHNYGHIPESRPTGIY
ncbi:MAG: hypothetical protein KDD31_01500 [Muricauda sp.]|nr:hypothetical protein [Allomuricauda sp.]